MVVLEVQLRHLVRAVKIIEVKAETVVEHCREAAVEVEGGLLVVPGPLVVAPVEVNYMVQAAVVDMAVPVVAVVELMSALLEIPSPLPWVAMAAEAPAVVVLEVVAVVERSEHQPYPRCI